jgi:hypothetical protein
MVITVAGKVIGAVKTAPPIAPNGSYFFEEGWCGGFYSFCYF